MKFKRLSSGFYTSGEYTIVKVSYPHLSRAVWELHTGDEYAYCGCHANSWIQTFPTKADAVQAAHALLTD